MMSLSVEEIVELFEHDCSRNYEYVDNMFTFQCKICGEKRRIGGNSPRCCGQVTFDSRNGNFGCERCGRVLYEKVVDGQGMYENEYVQDANPQKRRHYRSRIHFYTHLRRYMGDTTGKIPERCYELVREKVDVNDRDAYEQARKLFKKEGLGGYYKHVFRVLYECGGRKPQLSSATIQKVKQDFNALEEYFYEHSDGICFFNNHGALVKERKSLGRFSRKSMPSLAMLLVILLEKNGHDIYYRMAYLKDDKLRQKVLDFYDAFTRDIIDPWRDDEPDD